MNSFAPNERRDWLKGVCIFTGKLAMDTPDAE